jgi:hypothetical protein
MDIGLIENIRVKNKKGQIAEWYIKVNFIWTNESVDKVIQKINNKKTTGTKTVLVEKTTGTKNHPVANRPINALSVIILNALRDGKYIIKEKNKNKKESMSKIQNNHPYFYLFIQTLPSNLQTQEVICSIYEYFEYRKETKNKIQSKITVTKLVNKIKHLEQEELIDCVDDSISKGWTGLFPQTNNKPKSNYTPKNNNKKYNPKNPNNSPDLPGYIPSPDELVYLDDEDKEYPFDYSD